MGAFVIVIVILMLLAARLGRAVYVRRGGGCCGRSCDKLQLWALGNFRKRELLLLFDVAVE